MSRWLVIGDCHFGEKGDSEKFNSNVLEFMRWSCKTGKKHNVDKVIQLGDWFHSRNKIQVQTLSYGIEGARILSNEFGRDNVFVIEGNHDLYYLNRLDISSVTALRPYVTIVDKPMKLNDKCFATPWIVDGEMWDTVINASKDNSFLFAHLELNGFMVNDAYEMEHGLSHKELKDYELVLTGHYHSLQTKDNILYVGTPYPITMNEANEDHGVFIFDDETLELEFVKYDAIKVISLKLSEIDKLDTIDPINTSIRIEIPDDIDDETILDDVRSLLAEKNFEEFKIKYKGKKSKQLLEADVTGIENVENIDAAVLSFISSSTEVDGVDKNLLSELYRQAMEKEKK